MYATFTTENFHISVLIVAIKSFLIQIVLVLRSVAGGISSMDLNGSRRLWNAAQTRPVENKAESHFIALYTGRLIHKVV